MEQFQSQFFLLVAIAAILVALVVAVVHVLKTAFNISNRYAPLLSIAVGLIIGFVTYFLPAIEFSLMQMVFAGFIAGLAACGAYDLSKVKK